MFLWKTHYGHFCYEWTYVYNDSMNRPISAMPQKLPNQLDEIETKL